MSRSLGSALLALACLSSCDREEWHPPLDPEYVWEGRGVSEWTADWSANQDEVRLRVDPTFDYGGQPWIDGDSRANRIHDWRLTVEEDGSRRLTLDAEDHLAGRFRRFGPRLSCELRFALDREDALSVVVKWRGDDGPPVEAKHVTGRVLVNTLDWAGADWFRCEYELVFYAHGRGHHVRGAIAIGDGT